MARADTARAHLTSPIFPGGKIEADESPRTALIREIREELDCDIEPIKALPARDHDYPEFTVRLTSLFE